MITDWETNFTDLQANDFGNLGKNNSGNILVGNHAVIFTEINSPRFFFPVGNVCVDNGTPLICATYPWQLYRNIFTEVSGSGVVGTLLIKGLALEKPHLIIPN